MSIGFPLLKPSIEFLLIFLLSKQGLSIGLLVSVGMAWLSEVVAPGASSGGWSRE